MRRNNNVWHGALLFLAGSLVCYVTLQWKFLTINYEVHVPELLGTIGAALVGLYIADTIQRKMARNQNQYTFIGAKLDVLWTLFNQYAEQFKYATQIDLSTVNQFHKQALISVGFLKNIFTAYNLSTAKLTELENFLEDFQTTLETMPIQQNIYDYSASHASMQSKLVAIHFCFMEILRQIHRI